MVNSRTKNRRPTYAHLPTKREVEKERLSSGEDTIQYSVDATISEEHRRRQYDIGRGVVHTPINPRRGPPVAAARELGS